MAPGLDDLRLSYRAQRVLRRSGLTTVGAIEAKSAVDLLGIPAFQAEYLEEVRRALAHHGRALRGENSPRSPEPGAQERAIDELQLGTGTLNCLRRAGVFSLEDLQALTVPELLGIDDLGQRRLAEIERALAASGGSPAKMPSQPSTNRSGRPHEDAPEISVQVHERYRAAADAIPAGGERAALARLLLTIVRDMPTTDLAVLDLRGTQTLAAVGSAYGLSRERVRQIEERGNTQLMTTAQATAAEMIATWNPLLSSRAVAERELFEPWLDDATELPTQQRLGQILLRAMDAVPPRTFSGRLTGWWTFAPDIITRHLIEISKHLPFDDSGLAALLENAPYSDTVPVTRIFGESGSPARYHEAAGAWVRATARHRDAAYLLLLRRGEPMRPEPIARSLRIKVHALRESLRRDDRFRMLRPSGDWALAEWRDYEDQSYANTLDAGLAILSELGPLPYSRYEQQVLARYPVSPAAVRQTLASDQIGRWPDGRVDRAERGAPPVEDPQPSKPDGMVVDDEAGTIVFQQPVTRDLLRGSGLGVPPYVTWWLQLRQAPRRRVFRTAGGDEVEVRRYLQGSAISSLRTFAQALGATEGCILGVKLNTRNEAAEIFLACSTHDHA